MLLKNSIKGLAALTMVATLTACSSGTANTDTTAKTETSEPTVEKVSGKVTMSGSTSMEKVANAAAEVFMEEYPDVTVTAEFTGSGAGIEAVTAGTVDIGNSSRSLKDEEKAKGVVENVIAIDGIAMVVDPANTVTDLTTEQIVSIYTGEVKNWSELGGNDEPIVVVGREASSGTRGAFEELLKIEDKCVYANELDTTGAAVAKVGSTAGAIAYVSLDAVDKSVKTLKLNGVEPTEATLKDGSYTLSRPFVMATKGEVSAQSEAVQTFFKWLASDAGKEVIKSVGLVTVD